MKEAGEVLISFYSGELGPIAMEFFSTILIRSD